MKYGIYFQSVIAALGGEPVSDPANEMVLAAADGAPFHLRLEDAAERVALYARLGAVRADRTAERLLCATFHGLGQHLAFCLEGATGQAMAIQLLHLRNLELAGAVERIRRFAEAVPVWTTAVRHAEAAGNAQSTLPDD